MTLTSLQALTWGTIIGAVVSALLLAAAESGWVDFNRLRQAPMNSVVSPAWPSDPTGAVRPYKKPASAVVATDDALTRRAAGGR